jgi:hypothetical protein
MGENFSQLYIWREINSESLQGAQKLNSPYILITKDRIVK